MARNRTISEGVRAGLLGAGAVALWFLGVDLITGRAFHTPAVLGESLLGLVGLTRNGSMFNYVALYTVWHVVTFVLLGIVVAWIINASEREPSALVGLFFLFLAFELGFHLYVYTLSLRGQSVDIAWYQIGAANLLAALVMGRYLFRAHPGALHQLNEALAGRT